MKRLLALSKFQAASAARQICPTANVTSISHSVGGHARVANKYGGVFY